ncbi:aspartate aminotransferase [Bacillus anthracis]|nr:aspartate aminotransferase [Bacillus anthracis]
MYSTGFGAPNNVRLSYATSLEQVEKALERIHTFMKSKVQA